MRNILNRIKRLTPEDTENSNLPLKPLLKFMPKALALAVLFIVFQAGIAGAVTVTASPNPATVNQSVSVNISAVFGSGISANNCSLVISYGDGGSYTDAGTCSTVSCSLSASHTYAVPGTYTITVTNKSGSCAIVNPNAPCPATTSVTVLAAGCQALSISTVSPLPTATVAQVYSTSISAAAGHPPYTYSLQSGTLPPGLTFASTGSITGTPTTAGTYSFTVKTSDSCGLGVQNSTKTFTLTVNPAGCSALSITTASPLSGGIVAQAYSANIAASGGQMPYTYRLQSGSLPPGLTLASTGSISGAPTTAGTYSFTVNTADSCGAGVQNTQKAFSITISQPVTTIVTPTTQNVRLNSSPANFRMTLGSAGLQSILYTFTATGAADMALQSNKGVFMAGGSVIGEVNTMLQANIRGGNANLNESLTIPVAISKRAEALRINKVTYSRTFTNGDISLTARADGVLVTEAGSEFSIKRIQIYFGNRRPETTVKMGQPLKAYVDLSFTGSGMLQGYWELDGRLLSTVNTHLTYGASVTFETPEAPKLQTFDPGSHIVRFVITSPILNLSLPEASYFVTTEEYTVKAVPIKLVTPEDKAVIEYAPLKFIWSDKGKNEKYLLEISDSGDKQKVFSAYVKGPEYLLQQPMLLKIFAPGGKYLWKVKGFDKDNAVSGVSGPFMFTFKEHSGIFQGR